jgi:uncharacterized OB-fold protein
MSFPTPSINAVSRPYWEGLRRGVLLYQRCLACNHAWLPAREACPNCLSTNGQWLESGGRGTIASWIIYHSAYDDAFKDRLPYNVTLVELDDGPRLLTNIVNVDASQGLALHARVELEIEWEQDLPLARFRLDSG